MTEMSYPALRAHHRCVEALVADPEVTGDLLLVGMWLARAIHLHLPKPAVNDGTSTWQLPDIARDLFPLNMDRGLAFNGQMVEAPSAEPDWRRVFEVLKNDIRRYDPKVDQQLPAWARPRCSGPMVRRASCGKGSYTWGYLTDVETGRKRLVGACRKHHDWFQQERKVNAAVVAATEAPPPPANAGGRLARHFLDIDWPALWVKLDESWTAPPEQMGSARPKLRVVLGDTGSSFSVQRTSSTAARPRFALINGTLS
ncbi:hypothetical protein ABT336_13150 [Micromonospora sp. NPDC000207]|uniref:hypothetical protein n=1 Tax=Micromonospora sp. NPDC000207 TaxID=3154246 RepID=UPI00332D5EE1